MSAPTRLFVYGTLLVGEDNHALLEGAPFAGAASTPPAYRLVDFGDHPGLVPGGGASVLGELYDVPAAALPALDEMEGHPTWYQRTSILLADGSRAEAYLLPAEQAAGLPEIPTGSWRARGG